MGVGSTRLVASYQSALDSMIETGRLMDSLKSAAQKTSHLDIIRIYSEINRSLLMEREALLNFAQAYEADFKEQHAMKCPNCQTELKDLGNVPSEGRTAHVMRCSGCGKHWDLKEDLVKITDPQLLSKLLADKDIQTAP